MVGDETNLAISLPAYSAEYNLNGTIVYYDMRSWYFPDEIRIDDKTPIKIKIFVNFYLFVKHKFIFCLPSSNSEEK